MDTNIGETIAVMMNKFFLKNPESILFYICENKDGRGFVRQNRFKKWFEKHNISPKKVLITGNISGLIHVDVLMLDINPERSIVRTHFEDHMQQLIASEKTGEITEIT